MGFPTNIPDIQIDDSYLNEIMTVMGFPLINLADLELTDVEKTTLTTDELERRNKYYIITLFVKPAIREYYKWFPKKFTTEYTIGTTFSVNFPTQETYGVTGARLNTYANTGPITTNPFFNNLFVKSISGKGKYGYDYGEIQAVVYEQAEMQSFVDSQKAFVVHVNKDERRVWGYSNITGRVIIDWASYDSDFGKIPFNRLNDVLDLCKANVLDFFGNLRGQQDSNLSNQFNYDLLLQRSSEIKERVLGEWKNFTKIVIQTN